MTSAARAMWDAPAAQPPPPHRVWRDWVLVAVLPPLVLFEAAVRPDVPWRWLWAAVLVVLVPTLLWRRVRPFTMLGVAFAVGTIVGVAVGGDPQLLTTAYFLILLYAVMRWGSGRAMLGGAALVIAGTLVPLAFAPTPVGDVIGALAVVVTTSTLGVAFRWRAGARARELEGVRLREREQLARDLHDTVAHHVSAIAIQAQAGTAVAPTDPGAAGQALRVIESEASRTLDELRSIVRVLRRADDAELAPTPGLDEVWRLARADGSGPAVHVEIDGVADAGVEYGSRLGDPGAASGASAEAPVAEALPRAVGAAVFRITQEAVTNARRHARGATRVDVRVHLDGAGVRLEVRDDGAPAPSAAPGFGITGMTERAALLGGMLTAGPATDGTGARGWVVRAVLPRAGWSS